MLMHIAIALSGRTAVSTPLNEGLIKPLGADKRVEGSLTSARVDRIGNRYSAKGPLTTFSVPPRTARSLTRDVIPVLSCDSDAGINFNLPPNHGPLGARKSAFNDLAPELGPGWPETAGFIGRRGGLDC